MSMLHACKPAATPTRGFHRVFALIAALGLLGAAAPALATPVIANSSYQIYIAGQSSGNVRQFTTLFDSASQTQTLGGQTLTVSEAVVDLGGGRWRLSIDLDSAGVDLFPTAGEAALVGIGVFGDGLNLDGAWFLEDARHSYSDPAGSSFTTGNLADDYRATHFAGAWGGLYPNLNVVFANGNVGGRGYDHIQFSFTVTQIPEPGAASLVAGALGLLALTRQRRRPTPGARAARAQAA